MTKTPLPRLPGAAALLLAALVFPARALAQPAPPPDLPPPPPPAPTVAQPVPPPPPAPARGGGFPGTPIPGGGTAPAGVPDWGATPPATEPPPPPAPPPAPVSYPGVTAKGLPLAQRGGILADVAGLLTGQQTTNFGTSTGGNPNAVVDLVVHIPVAEHTFVDADLPLGFGALGNPMVGAHHVFRPADRLWLTLGGAFGFPLINNVNLESFAAATAFWDAERFMAFKMPFAIRMGLEGHAGLFEFRLQADPVWAISIASCQLNCNDSRDVHYAAFQHALEVQVGHEIGGGLRYQGVATGTNTPSVVGVDNGPFGGGSGVERYQGTLEPFFRLYHDPVFFRLGLLMPLSNPLGAPFDHTWGVRATVGYSLD